MQDKAVLHRCNTATHRAAVQRGFSSCFCIAVCIAVATFSNPQNQSVKIFRLSSFVFPSRLLVVCIAVQKKESFLRNIVYCFLYCRLYSQFSGATRVLLTYTSKCKWLPVLSPVLPTAAIV